MKNRIIGIDVARALAIIGMIIVNFKVVLGESGTNWICCLTRLLEGKAAAVFVVLAGIGLALMTNSSIQNKDKAKINSARKRIAKRAVFLFVVGISHISIWPADILHFYSVYMMISILLLTHKEETILFTGLVLVLIYPLLLIVWNYDTGWNYESMEYLGFWTIKGFIRNLFFNGFHPVIPWVAFLLTGYWFGKQDLNNTIFAKKSLKVSGIIFIAIQCISHLSIFILSEGNLTAAHELTEILGTKPMPPLPVYMFSGMTMAIIIISACILIAKRFPHNRIINALNKTGQLALTFYVAHVIIGMGIIEAINPLKMGNYSIDFSVIYALIFSLVCIQFAVIWRKHKEFGPLEWVMRKLTE